MVLAATRAWFSTAAFTPPASTAVDATWSGSPTARRRMTTLSSKGASALAAGSTITVTTTGVSYIDRQYWLGPLKAQTISGNVKGQLMAREFVASDNVNRSNIGIRAVSGDGLTIRGTLLAVGVAGGNTVELLDTGFRNRSIAIAAALTSTVVQDGDYLLIEVGFRSTTAGTTPEAAFLYGEAGTDLAENETDTTQNPGWMEFANGLLLADNAVTVGADDANADVTGPALTFGAASVTVGGVDAFTTATQPGITLGPVTVFPSLGLNAMIAFGDITQPGLLLGPATLTLGAADAHADITGPIITTAADYEPPDAEARHFGGAKAVDPSTHPVLNPELARVYFLKTGTTAGYVSLVSAQKLPITQVGWNHLFVANDSNGDCDIKDAAGNVIATLPVGSSARISLVAKTPTQGSWLVKTVGHF